LFTAAQAETDTDEVFAQITLQPDPDVSVSQFSPPPAHGFFFLFFFALLVFRNVRCEAVIVRNFLCPLNFGF
jgi:hypothetical protein